MTTDPPQWRCCWCSSSRRGPPRSIPGIDPTPHLIHRVGVMGVITGTREGPGKGFWHSGGRPVVVAVALLALVVLMLMPR